MTENAVKIVAEAIFNVRDDEFDLDEWGDLDATERERYECYARAAIAALEAAGYDLSEPERWEWGTESDVGFGTWITPQLTRQNAEALVGNPMFPAQSVVRRRQPGPWVPVESEETNV